MKKDRWTGIMAAGLIAVAVVAVATGDAEAQKFKLRDLFQKNSESNGDPEQMAAKGDAGQTAGKDGAAMEKTGSVESGEHAGAGANDSGGAAKESTTGKLKELSKGDQLKSLAGKLDKAGGDPDALLQSARERFREMKAKESSSKAEPAAGARSSGAGKEDAGKTAAPVAQKKVEATTGKSAGNPDAAAGKTPVAKPVAKTMSGGEAEGAAKTVDSSRPPSLTSVAAVTAPPKAPPENLQLSLAASNVPPPKPLVPVKEKGKTAKAANAMEITSKEVEMDNTKRTTTFIGDVDLRSPEPNFHLKSDRLLIHMNEEGQSAKGKGKEGDGEMEVPFKEAVATGARVIVERQNADGTKDVGQARKVVYDAQTGDLVLSGGPPQLQSGERLVKTYSESATITLKKNGNHKVSDKGAGGGNIVIIPVGKEKKDGSAKEPNLIPTKLDDISNRK